MANQEIATLGGGCFWCLEAVYQEMKGVEKVASGYMGGRIPNPTYRQVCGGDTGHIEVVQVTFDPAVVPYRDILEVFFAIHDPTTMDRQGNDVGEQYRSAIFYHSEAQKQTAETLIRETTAEGVWGKPIVTQVKPAETFYVAEDYHQNYYRTNPNQPYCSYIVAPKLRKFREKLARYSSRAS
ncbi:MAG TPA: peptide-methionine (S)-S-oxide reductase MsrA [Bryobacteraceae bacterium]|jgi:peptide-methionine (S)-S-oxide reductase|nr:peptide-methionine (S)-S-oxide reductase MsrA [Bryobacteraceae bacterium]